MTSVEDYVARTEGTCGEEKDVVVTFKYNRKSEAIQRIMKRAKLQKSIANMIFEMAYEGASFRLYPSGRVIFRSLKDTQQLHKILTDLLL